MALFDLGGRVALVTGAGQGNGVGIARLLAGQGAAVAVNDLHGERAQKVAGSIPRAVAVPFDVTDPAAVAVGVQAVERALGPIDILVNNAGVPEGMAPQRFREQAPERWRQFVDLNLYGVLHCTHAVLDGMCTRGFGRVVIVSSAAGQTGLGIGVSLYGAGKAAAIGFMRHLAVEVASTGVTVNAVALGLMGNVGDTELVRFLSKGVPVGRLGTPEDIGAACVYLASNEASWVTGQVLGVNGGAVTA
jgi:NAD(P)-dependent dehydrogenase (short-subunit alcohol dehydrogenase family)